MEGGVGERWKGEWVKGGREEWVKGGREGCG